MGIGIDLARDESPEHAAILDNFKDQLLIALVNRLGDSVSIPVAEIDATGKHVMTMAIQDGNFVFVLQQKQ